VKWNEYRSETIVRQNMQFCHNYLSKVNICSPILEDSHISIDRTVLPIGVILYLQPTDFLPYNNYYANDTFQKTTYMNKVSNYENY